MGDRDKALLGVGGVAALGLGALLLFRGKKEKKAPGDEFTVTATLKNRSIYEGTEMPAPFTFNFGLLFDDVELWSLDNISFEPGMARTIMISGVIPVALPGVHTFTLVAKADGQAVREFPITAIDVVEEG